MPLASRVELTVLPGDALAKMKLSALLVPGPVLPVLVLPALVSASQWPESLPCGW